MDPETERVLIQECKTDLNHFTEIYKAYIQDTYRYAYSLTNNPHYAEDAASETFIKALKYIQSYHPVEGRSIKYWLMRICRNHIFDTYRKKSEQLIEPGLNEHELMSTDESILDKALNQDLINRTLEYIKTFSVTEQEIMNLRIWQEFSFAEIASLVDKSQGAVKMTYYRCLKKIHTQFESERISL